MSMFVGLPLLWSAMMAWIGLGVGRSIEGFSRGSMSAASAGTGSGSARSAGGMLTGAGKTFTSGYRSGRGNP
jgi:hypothetical protein